MTLLTPKRPGLRQFGINRQLNRQLVPGLKLEVSWGTLIFKLQKMGDLPRQQKGNEGELTLDILKVIAKINFVNSVTFAMTLYRSAILKRKKGKLCI